MKIKAGRNNLAVTLFVPWDCGNNCPFCTTKKEYKNKTSFSLSKQIETMYQIWGIDDIKDVVITGGEPFADICSLTELLTSIYSMSMLKKKNVYINTSGDFFSDEQINMIFSLFMKFRSIIKGVNISEHIALSFAKKTSKLIDVLHELHIPVKLNCVLTGEEKYSDLFEFVYKWQKKVNTISFRKDYRLVVTDDDLKGEDLTLLILKDVFGNYTSHGCDVCNDDVFKDGKVHYHRGKENTLIKKENCIVVNDIIIKQDGKLYLDWNRQYHITPIELLNKWEVMTKEKTKKKIVSYSTEGYCGGGDC